MRDVLEDLDFEPEGEGLAWHINHMARESELLVKSAPNLSWRAAHPRIAVYASVATLALSTLSGGFAGLELGGLLDKSDRASDISLATQHRQCLKYIGKVAKSDTQGINVNITTMPQTDIDACGLSKAQIIPFDSTNDGNYPLGSSVTNVEMPPEQELESAIQADEQAAKNSSSFSQNKLLGLMFGGIIGYSAALASLSTIKRRNTKHENA